MMAIKPTINGISSRLMLSGIHLQQIVRIYLIIIIHKTYKLSLRLADTCIPGRRNTAIFFIDNN